MYINLKELTDWLVAKYGACTGVPAMIMFEIFEHLAEMEKVEVADNET